MSDRNIFKEVLYEIKQEELEGLPAENEIEYEFSREFKASVKKLIKEQKKTYSSKTLKRFIIILVAAILFMLIASSAVADSDKILDFIYKVRNDGVLFISDKSASEPSENYKDCIYSLTYIPEEYELSFSDIQPDYNTAFWVWKKIESRETISLDQKDNVGFIGINTNGNYVEELEINSVNVIYVEQEETIHCFWKEKGYYFDLSYPIELGRDFAERNIGKLVELTE